MISKEKLDALLNAFDLGSSTAENDPLLEEAKIETQEFYDLFFNDRIDIIKGIKGSGKTALYRLFYFLKEFSIENKQLHCIFGVETTGDPVFRLFNTEFAKYDAVQFENFWSIYFILLVAKYINDNESIKKTLGSDVKVINDIISNMGIKIKKYEYSLKDSINIIQKLIGAVTVTTSISPSDNATQIVSNSSISFDLKKMDELKVKPLYISEFRDRIASILYKYKIKIWLLLDRLDEVFPHHSNEEKYGLIGLLKSSYNFNCPELRIKIFIRDDIIDFISEDGFTALTHVFDRCSNTMNWSKDQVLQLIVLRISAIEGIRNYYSIEKEKLESGFYREHVFNKVFPSKIGKTPTIDWLYSNCGDANGVVTPRDIIDFFNFAKNEQVKAFKVNPKEQEYLITENHLKMALQLLSKHKRVIFLKAEFPQLKSTLLKFEGGFSEYDVDSIKFLFGDEYLRVIDDLKSIGFMRYNHKTGTYKIPVLWRKGFNIRNRKAKFT